MCEFTQINMQHSKDAAALLSSDMSRDKTKHKSDQRTMDLEEPDKGLTDNMNYSTTDQARDPERLLQQITRSRDSC